MYETKPNQNGMNINLLTPVEVNNATTPFNTFNGEQKITLKSNCRVLFIICINISMGYPFYFFLFMTISGIDSKIVRILIFVFVLLIHIFFLIKTLQKSVHKTELIKDVTKNKFEINSLNIFKKSVTTVTLNINSIIFYDVSYETETDDGSYTTYGLIIVNTFQNKDNIDLDRSDIRNKPRKIYYLIDDIREGNMKKQLCDFVGCSPEPDIPIFLNIDKYMGRPYSKNCPNKFGKYGITRYMKISDTFFAYYNDTEKKDAKCLYICDFYFAFFGFIGIMIVIYSKLDLIIKIIILSSYIFLLLFTNLLTLYCVKNSNNKKIRRIDIIYSNNFDRIFIGLVNIDEESFLNTFLFDIHQIQKFTLIPLTGKYYILGVTYKSGEMQKICRIKEDRATLDGLLFILNERLDNKNEQTINYNNNNLLVNNW